MVPSSMKIVDFCVNGLFLKQIDLQAFHDITQAIFSIFSALCIKAKEHDENNGCCLNCNTWIANMFFWKKLPSQVIVLNHSRCGNHSQTFENQWCNVGTTLQWHAWANWQTKTWSNLLLHHLYLHDIFLLNLETIWSCWISEWCIENLVEKSPFCLSCHSGCDTCHIFANKTWRVNFDWIYHWAITWQRFEMSWNWVGLKNRNHWKPWRNPSECTTHHEVWIKTEMVFKRLLSGYCAFLMVFCWVSDVRRLS